MKIYECVIMIVYIVSIKDTILDLGNYCFMTAALMECIEDYKEEMLKSLNISNNE